jgi:hypothetical protein
MIIARRPAPPKDGVNTISFRWHKKHRYYFIGSSSELIETTIVTKEHLVAAVTEDWLTVFPNYDPSIHEVEAPYLQSWKEETISFCQLNKKTITTGLPYGVYKLSESIDHGICAQPMTFSSDTYLDFGQVFNIKKDFEKFIKKPKRDNTRSRAAVLLYGPPGNGKTASICELAKYAEELKCRVFFVSSKVDFTDLLEMRQVLQHEHTVFVIEELTERTGHTGTEKLLSFLDGETSWNNSYVVATTNYPDELPWNIIDRPGRFGTIVEVKNPTKEQRMSYMKIMALNLEELEEAADATEGLCFDYVKCTVLDALDNGTSVKEEVQKYKERREKVSKAFKSTKLGLGE